VNEVQAVLWQLNQMDVTIDSLRQKCNELVAVVRELTTLIGTVKESIEAAESRVEELRGEEKNFSRRLSKYIKRRDDTKVLLDEGRVSDYIAASRQYEQCAAIVIEIEEDLLNCMERLEEAVAYSAAETRRLEATRVADKSARDNYHNQVPGLKSKIDQLLVSRRPLLERLLPEDSRRYENVRSQKGTAVAALSEDSCGSCHVTVPLQVCSNIRSGRILHHCTGCGRFLCVEAT